MFQIAALVCGLVSLVCWIVVLIKMFQSNVVSGVIGLICGLWAFIWGWQHKDELDGWVMPVWTIVFIGGIVCNVLNVMSMAK